jgi:hypothetical protein
MEFTAVALAGLATVAMASPAAEANPAPAPAPQPEATAEPAFSSWGKKYNPHLWNGWGDAPSQVYRREAAATGTASATDAAKPAETGFTEEEEKANLAAFERRDPAFSSWGKKYNPHVWNGWGDAPGQVY